MLAQLLEDNASLHRIYPLLAAPENWAAAIARATGHVEAIRHRTAHERTRAACASLLAALAQAQALRGDSRESLAQAMREAGAAMALPATSAGQRSVLLLLQELLRHRLQGMAPEGGPGIPRVVHLVKTDPATSDLPLVQYLCYRSVLAHCRGYRVILHAPETPRGPRWARLLPHLELHVAPPPQLLGHHRLLGAAHQSDAWRVRQLIEQGGFYFDWDVLLLRPPEQLRGNVCVMALERQEPDYDEVLGVAVIGAEPGSRFLAAWLAAMPSVFNPRKYVAHSTVLSRQLALGLPSLVRVLDYRAFYDPGWGEAAMRWLFDPGERLPDDELRERFAASTAIHLFNSHANFLRWAGELTEKDIEAPRCNLATLMRPYL